MATRSKVFKQGFKEHGKQGGGVPIHGRHQINEN